MTIKIYKNKTRVALLCGGPSLERGISLNSARSVMDHLGSLGVNIVPIYFNEQKKPYKISTAQLYSNTPSDFDFKLKKTGKELTESNLINILEALALFSTAFMEHLVKMAKFRIFSKNITFLLSVLRLNHAKWLLISIKPMSISVHWDFMLQIPLF